MAANVPGLSKARGHARRSGGLVDYVERRGINKGIFGGHKGWLYVGIGLWVLRRVRTAAKGGTPSILISEALGPGERIIIANGRATLDGNSATSVSSKG